MNQIGSYIRDVRRSKGMKMKDLAKGIVSNTFLSKFERGQNDIGAEKLLLLIKRLNISPLEFFNGVFHGQDTDLNIFYKKVKLAHKEENLYLFNQLLTEEENHYQQTGNYCHRHNAILIKQLINHYSGLPYDLHLNKEIIDYLMQVEDWTSYEFGLLSNFIFCFSKNQILLFSKSVIKKVHGHLDNTIYAQEFYRFMLNIVERLIDLGELREAHQLIHELDSMLTGTRHYYELNLLAYFRGVIYLKLGDAQKGKDLVEESIKMMTQFGHYSLAKKCQIESKRITDS